MVGSSIKVSRFIKKFVVDQHSKRINAQMKIVLTIHVSVIFKIYKIYEFDCFLKYITILKLI